MFLSFPCSDEVAFLNGSECGECGHECYGNNGPEQHRCGKEEKKSRQFVGLRVWKAEPFADDQCRYLIDELDGDYDPGPDPEPCRNLHDGDQPYGAASDKADVCHTVQHGTGFTLGMKLPRQITVQHITDAAETVGYPECCTCRIKQKKADGSENSERRDYVWNLLHIPDTQMTSI